MNTTKFCTTTHFVLCFFRWVKVISQRTMCKKKRKKKHWKLWLNWLQTWEVNVNLIIVFILTDPSYNERLLPLEKNINIKCFFQLFIANMQKKNTTKITEKAYEYFHVYKHQFHTRLAFFHCTFDFYYAKLYTCTVVNDSSSDIYME